MSSDFKDVQAFVTELVAGLKANVPTREGDAAGGLFPNGVNDIYAKITVGGVQVELEISAASEIHSAQQPGAPTIGIGHRPDQLVRPMYVYIPPGPDNAPVHITTSYTNAHGALRTHAFSLSALGSTQTLDIG